MPLTTEAAHGLADPAWFGELWAEDDRTDIWKYGVSTQDDEDWARTYAEEALDSLSMESDYVEPADRAAWLRDFAAAYRRRAIALYEGRVDSATCKHPVKRLYTWLAYDGTRCVACCACGASLAGAA